MSLGQRVTDALTLRHSYRRVFNSPDGQRVLDHLMRVGCVTVPACGPEQQGTQRLVLSILKYIHSSDEGLKKVIEEAYKREHEKPSFT